MSVPPRLKKNFDFYGRFLKSISPETYDVPNANWGFDISKKSAIRWMYFKQKLKYTPAGSKIKQWRQEDQNYLSKATAVEKELFESLISLPIVQNTIDVDFIRRLKSFTSEDFFSVLTLMKITSV